MTGQRILILGLAREGESLARYFAQQGVEVTVTDRASEDKLRDRVTRLSNLPINLVLGADHPDLVHRADRFFVSPGVPESSPVYRAAAEAGLTVESMTTLFFDLCPAPIVGITGSSGKTTTTGLIGHILQSAGVDALVGGNIGRSMLDLLPSVGPGSVVVLELSSFQLSILRKSPHIAVVTNISPNHLDRHGSMEDYIRAKLHIVQHQSRDDRAVLNAADPERARFERATRGQVSWFGLEGTGSEGATVRDSQAGTLEGGRFTPVISLEEIPLLGRHNVENVLAALAATALLGADPHSAARAIRTFRPAPHRLQVVGERAGVRYVDDSIATSPARAVVALQAIGAPVLLIAGGRDKNLPWDGFARLAAERARALLLMGEAADLIEQAVLAVLKPSDALDPEHILRCSSLEDAVERAGAMAMPGDVVLLSPGCTSYDMFDNFEQRGNAFARVVESLDAA